MYVSFSAFYCVAIVLKGFCFFGHEKFISQITKCTDTNKLTGGEVIHSQMHAAEEAFKNDTEACIYKLKNCSVENVPIEEIYDQMLNICRSVKIARNRSFVPPNLLYVNCFHTK